METRRLVAGFSGATGSPTGWVCSSLRAVGFGDPSGVTPARQQTRAYETGLSARALTGLADVNYRHATPCSVRTLAAVAQGLGDNILTRAADVTLKQRRRLVPLVQRFGRARLADR
jgi:4-hydroxy-3-polyprenylbenzoate decarboxylase